MSIRCIGDGIRVVMGIRGAIRCIGDGIRVRPPVKWRDRVQEYVRERGGGSLRNLEQARREFQDRERWKLFCRGHPLVGDPRSRCRNEQTISVINLSSSI